MECHWNPHQATVLEDDGYEADRLSAIGNLNVRLSMRTYNSVYVRLARPYV